MKTDREILDDALHILDKGQWIHPESTLHDEIRARLAEKEDEPAAWLAVGDGKVGLRAYLHKENALDHTKNIEPLYRHPTRKPVRLSDEEINAMTTEVVKCKQSIYWLARAIEQAVLEKNQ